MPDDERRSDRPVDQPTAAMPPPARRSGDLLDGRYRLDGLIGRGGMADVFRARDDVLGRAVAVKVFRSDLDDPTAAARQQNEMRALAALNHPNLVVVYDARLQAPADPTAELTPGRRPTGHTYLVMELVEGQTLAQRMTSGALPVAQVASIGSDVASALAAVHARGLVHRDIKPANILVTPDGRAKLSDFGIAQLVGADRLTGTALVLGTAAYLSPEQARGVTVDAATDIYALGLVLLEALTGRREFEGTPMEAAAARLSRAPRVPSDLPNGLTGLLQAMTALDPAERPSAARVADVLAGRASPPAGRGAAVLPVESPTTVLAQTGQQRPAGAVPGGTAVIPAVGVAAPPVRPSPPTTDGEPPRRRTPVGLIVTLLLLVIAAAIGLALWLRGHPSGTGGTNPTTSPPGTTSAPVKSSTAQPQPPPPASPTQTPTQTPTSSSPAPTPSSSSPATRSSSPSTTAPTTPPSTSTSPAPSTSTSTSPAPSTSSSTSPSASSSASSTTSSSTSTAPARSTATPSGTSSRTSTATGTGTGTGNGGGGGGNGNGGGKTKPPKKPAVDPPTAPPAPPSTSPSSGG